MADRPDTHGARWPTPTILRWHLPTSPAWSGRRTWRSSVARLAAMRSPLARPVESRAGLGTIWDCETRNLPAPARVRIIPQDELTKRKTATVPSAYMVSTIEQENF